MDKNYKKSNESQIRWGFYSGSEIINGRLAMVLLILIIILETITQKTILTMIPSIFN